MSCIVLVALLSLVTASEPGVSTSNTSSDYTTVRTTTSKDPWSPVVGDTEGAPTVTEAGTGHPEGSFRRRAAHNLVESLRKQLMRDNYDYLNKDSEESTLETLPSLITSTSKHSAPVRTTTMTVLSSLATNNQLAKNMQPPERTSFKPVQVASVKIPSKTTKRKKARLFDDAVQLRAIDEPLREQNPYTKAIMPVEHKIEVSKRDLLYYMDDGHLRRSNDLASEGTLTQRQRYDDIESDHTAQDQVNLTNISITKNSNRHGSHANRKKSHRNSIDYSHRDVQVGKFVSPKNSERNNEIEDRAENYSKNEPGTKNSKYSINLQDKEQLNVKRVDVKNYQVNTKQESREQENKTYVQRYYNKSDHHNKLQHKPRHGREKHNQSKHIHRKKPLKEPWYELQVINNTENIPPNILNSEQNDERVSDDNTNIRHYEQVNEQPADKKNVQHNSHHNEQQNRNSQQQGYDNEDIHRSSHQYSNHHKKITRPNDELDGEPNVLVGDQNQNQRNQPQIIKYNDEKNVQRNIQVSGPNNEERALPNDDKKDLQNSLYTGQRDEQDKIQLDDKNDIRNSYQFIDQSIGDSNKNLRSSRYSHQGEEQEKTQYNDKNNVRQSNEQRKIQDGFEIKSRRSYLFSDQSNEQQNIQLKDKKKSRYNSHKRSEHRDGKKNTQRGNQYKDQRDLPRTKRIFQRTTLYSRQIAGQQKYMYDNKINRLRRHRHKRRHRSQRLRDEKYIERKAKYESDDEPSARRNDDEQGGQSDNQLDEGIDSLSDGVYKAEDYDAKRDDSQDSQIKENNDNNREEKQQVNSPPIDDDQDSEDNNEQNDDPSSQQDDKRENQYSDNQDDDGQSDEPDEELDGRRMNEPNDEKQVNLQDRKFEDRRNDSLLFDSKDIKQEDRPDNDINNTQDETSIVPDVKYKLLKVRARDGSRRSGGGERQFLQERGANGVALISLDEAPFPQFRLPRARRQYMQESHDKRPPLVEQLPKSGVAAKRRHSARRRSHKRQN